MKTGIILLASVSILICGCAHTPPTSSIPDWQIEGNQVRNPNKPNVVYYFAGRWRVSRLPSEPKKYAGFWVSEDSGKTWSKCSNISDFMEIFFNPQNGLLYGIILDEYLFKQSDGLLVPRGGRKLVMSPNGDDWKDITPSGGHLGMASCIFPDPDHTNRICVLNQQADIFVFQALTDDLSEWTSCSRDEWSKRHKGWNWTGFYAEFSAGGPVAASKHWQVGNDWRERLRQKSHAELSKRGGFNPGVFADVEEVGNKESVPLLIAALRWYPPIKIDGHIAMIDTAGMCIDALRTLTGQDLGFDPDKWEKWWKEKGKNLPPEYFQPKSVRETVEQSK